MSITGPKARVVTDSPFAREASSNTLKKQPERDRFESDGNKNGKSSYSLGSDAAAFQTGPWQGRTFFAQASGGASAAQAGGGSSTGSAGTAPLLVLSSSPDQLPAAGSSPVWKVIPFENFRGFNFGAAKAVTELKTPLTREQAETHLINSALPKKILSALNNKKLIIDLVKSTNGKFTETIVSAMIGKVKNAKSYLLEKPAPDKNAVHTAVLKFAELNAAAAQEIRFWQHLMDLNGAVVKGKKSSVTFSFEQKDLEVILNRIAEIEATLYENFKRIALPLMALNRTGKSIDEKILQGRMLLLASVFDKKTAYNQLEEWKKTEPSFAETIKHIAKEPLSKTDAETAFAKDVFTLLKEHLFLEEPVAKESDGGDSTVTTTSPTPAAMAPEISADSSPAALPAVASPAPAAPATPEPTGPTEAEKQANEAEFNRITALYREVIDKLLDILNEKTNSSPYKDLSEPVLGKFRSEIGAIMKKYSEKKLEVEAYKQDIIDGTKQPPQENRTAQELAHEEAKPFIQELDVEIKRLKIDQLIDFYNNTAEELRAIIDQVSKDPKYASLPPSSIDGREGFKAGMAKEIKEVQASIKELREELPKILDGTLNSPAELKSSTAEEIAKPYIDALDTELENLSQPLQPLPAGVGVVGDVVLLTREAFTGKIPSPPQPNTGDAVLESARDIENLFFINLLETLRYQRNTFSEAIFSSGKLELPLAKGIVTHLQKTRSKEYPAVPALGPKATSTDILKAAKKWAAAQEAGADEIFFLERLLSLSNYLFKKGDEEKPAVVSAEAAAYIRDKRIDPLKNLLFRNYQKVYPALAAADPRIADILTARMIFDAVEADPDVARLVVNAGLNEAQKKNVKRGDPAPLANATAKALQRWEAEPVDFANLPLQEMFEKVRNARVDFVLFFDRKAPLREKYNQTIQYWKDYAKNLNARFVTIDTTFKAAEEAKRNTLKQTIETEIKESLGKSWDLIEEARGRKKPNSKLSPPRKVALNEADLFFNNKAREAGLPVDTAVAKADAAATATPVTASVAAGTPAPVTAAPSTAGGRTISDKYDANAKKNVEAYFNYLTARKKNFQDLLTAEQVVSGSDPAKAAALGQFKIEIDRRIAAIEKKTADAKAKVGNPKAVLLPEAKTPDYPDPEAQTRAEVEDLKKSTGLVASEAPVAKNADMQRLTKFNLYLTAYRDRLKAALTENQKKYSLPGGENSSEFERQVQGYVNDAESSITQTTKLMLEGRSISIPRGTINPEKDNDETIKEKGTKKADEIVQYFLDQPVQEKDYTFTTLYNKAERGAIVTYLEKLKQYGVKIKQQFETVRDNGLTDAQKTSTAFTTFKKAVDEKIAEVESKITRAKEQIVKKEESRFQPEPFLNDTPEISAKAFLQTAYAESDLKNVTVPEAAADAEAPPQPSPAPAKPVDYAVRWPKVYRLLPWTTDSAKVTRRECQITKQVNTEGVATETALCIVNKKHITVRLKSDLKPTGWSPFRYALGKPATIQNSAMTVFNPDDTALALYPKDKEMKGISFTDEKEFQKEILSAKIIQPKPKPEKTFAKVEGSDDKKSALKTPCDKIAELDFSDIEILPNSENPVFGLAETYQCGEGNSTNLNTVEMAAVVSKKIEASVGKTLYTIGDWHWRIPTNDTQRGDLPLGPNKEAVFTGDIPKAPDFNIDTALELADALLKKNYFQAPPKVMKQLLLDSNPEACTAEEIINGNPVVMEDKTVLPQSRVAACTMFSGRSITVKAERELTIQKEARKNADGTELAPAVRFTPSPWTYSVTKSDGLNLAEKEPLKKGTISIITRDGKYAAVQHDEGSVPDKLFTDNETMVAETGETSGTGGTKEEETDSDGEDVPFWYPAQFFSLMLGGGVAIGNGFKKFRPGVGDQRLEDNLTDLKTAADQSTYSQQPFSGTGYIVSLNAMLHPTAHFGRPFGGLFLQGGLSFGKVTTNTSMRESILGVGFSLRELAGFFTREFDLTAHANLLRWGSNDLTGEYLDFGLPQVGGCIGSDSPLALLGFENQFVQACVDYTATGIESGSGNSARGINVWYIALQWAPSFLNFTTQE